MSAVAAIGCGSDRAEGDLGYSESDGGSTPDASHSDASGLTDSGHQGATDADVADDVGQATDVRETSGTCDPDGDPLNCQSEYFLRPEMASCRMTPTVKHFYECSECHSNEECPDGYICRAYSVCVEP